MHCSNDLTKCCLLWFIQSCIRLTLAHSRMQSRQKKCSQFSGVATGWLLNELRQIGHLSESSSELIPTRSADVPPQAPSTDLLSSSSSSAGENYELCFVCTIQPTFRSQQFSITLRYAVISPTLPGQKESCTLIFLSVHISKA